MSYKIILPNRLRIGLKIRLSNNLCLIFFIFLCLIYCVNIFSVSLLIAQQTQIDSLKGLAKPIQSPQKKCDIYTKIGQLFLDNQKKDSARCYFDKAIIIARENGLIDTEITLLRTTIRHILKTQYPDQAIKYYQKIITLLQKQNKESAMGDAIGNMGGIYAQQGKYAEGLKFLQQAFEIKNKYQEYPNMLRLLTNIGVIHLSQGNDIQNAFFYYEKALKIYEKINDKEAISETMSVLLNNLGYVSMRLEKYKQAMDFYKKSLDTQQEYKNTKNIGETYLGMAYVATHQKDEKTALEYYQKSLEIFEKQDRKSSFTYPLQGIARIYFGKNDLDKSLEYSQKALKIAQTLKIPLEAKDVYLSLYEITKKQKNYQKSLEYFENYQLIKDSLDNVENIKKIAKMETNFQVNQKQREIEILAKDNIILDNQNLLIKKEAESQKLFALAERETNKRKADSLTNLAQKALLNEQKALLNEQKITAEAKLKKAITDRQIAYQQNVLYGLGFLLLFGFVISLVIWRGRQALQRKNTEITRKNAEIITQQTEIKTQAENLSQLNDWKNKIFAILAHDLRSPLVSFQGVDMQIEHFLNKNNPEKIQKLGKLITQKSKYLASVLDNILHWAMLQNQQISIQHTPICVYELVQEFAENKEIIKNNIPKDFILNTDQVAISVILRNFISNALKFTPENGEICVFLQQKDNAFCINVKNTGEGLSQEQINHIFSERVESTKGLHGEKGIGIGLTLCKEFAKKINATLEVTSIVGQETTFSVIL